MPTLSESVQSSWKFEQAYSDLHQRKISSNDCGKKFLKSGICKSVKSFACEERQKAFSRRDNLRKHILTQKDFGPTHTSPECDQSFMKKCNLL